MPYNYQVLKIYEGEAKEISKLEHELQNINKEHTYVPCLEFGGMYECFSLIEGMKSELNQKV